MSSEYRFLRFESVGISTLIFLFLGVFPLFFTSFINLMSKDITVAFTAIAGAFLISLPLGYIEHQWVVNVYRSPNKIRTIHKMLDDLILQIQDSHAKGKDEKHIFFQKFNTKSKVSFLSILIDLIIFFNDGRLDKSVFNRLSDRWSHFYARRAVGRWAPIISLILSITIVLFGLLLNWQMDLYWQNLLACIVIWAVIIIISVRIVDSYSEKLWLEINHLEAVILVSRYDEIKSVLEKVVKYFMEHPEYLDPGGSYGFSLYKL